MQRELRPEDIELPSPKLQRTLSKSSDGRTPSISGSSFAVPPPLHPDPSYIASSAASTIVYNAFMTCDQNSPVSDQEMDADMLTVSPSALALINAFLDQLLFGFLANSRSTSILSLRPAISEVLKPRLAKEASEGADEELKGYLAGGDDEELLDFQNGQELKGERNLHQTFRRTRLRCMVYTRLGNMEEEDEEELLADEQSQGSQDSGQHRLSRDLGNVSPAAAIFLTSILEFLGERALQIAGEAAFSRMGPRTPATGGQQMILEERDVQKIAFNKSLGRLWRSWKAAPRASILSPRLSGLYHGQRSSSFSASAKPSRDTSISEQGELGYFDETAKRQSPLADSSSNNGGTLDRSLKTGRLPEEPDLMWTTGKGELGKISRDRPRSMLEYPLPFPAIENENPTESAAKDISGPQEEADRPKQRRLRSSSLPAKQTPYTSPINETFTTPLETPDQFLGNRFNDSNADEPVPKLTDSSDTASGSKSANPAVSTMYDGALSPGTDRLSEIPTDASSRGASMSEYSMIDHDMTPQALNLKKPTPAVEAEPPYEGKSPVSSISSNYSFQAGNMSPLPKEDLEQDQIGKDEDPDTSSFSQSDDRSMGYATLAYMQGDRLRTLDDSGTAVKRDIPVLYEAPSNKDVIYDPEISGKNLQQEVARSTPMQAPKGGATNGQGAPPLAPLEELLDAAHDTSDESSSLGPNHEASKAESLRTSQNQSYGAYPPAFPSEAQTALKNITPSKLQSNAFYPSPTIGHDKQSAAASKYVDIRNQPLVVNTGVERAAVQRVSPSSATARDFPVAAGRTSTSSVNGRPVTPGSTTSGISNKFKGIIGRESNDAVRQPMPRRGSSENGDGLTSGSRKATRGGGKEQDFEQLIRSDETIQYTLTPQNMREMEKTDPPRWSAQQSTSPPTHNPNGLRANPTNGSTAKSFSPGPGYRPNPARDHPPAAPKPSGNRTKSVTARDAAAKDNSLRDFADFIRSTGPDTDPKTMSKSMNTGAHSAIHSAMNTRKINNTGLEALPEKVTDKKVLTQVPTASSRADSSLPARKSSKLKARDPTSPSVNMTADLADFLRSGPGGGPVDNLRQAQRSPGFPPATNGVSNGGVRDAMGSGNSVASTQDSFAPSKMTQSSTNSHTGLLESSNRAAAKSNEKRSVRTDDAPIQARKQRRVKDPYDLGSDDEDNNVLPPKISREEESLGDFLRNYNPPPPSTTTRSPPQGVKMQTSPEPNQKSRKGSSSSLKDRLTRNIAAIPNHHPSHAPKAPSKKSLSKSPPPTTGKRQQVQCQHSGQSPSTSPASSRSRTGVAPQLPPLNPRATSPHLVSQTGTKMDSYKPTRPTYAAHVDRRPKQNLQAREEVGFLAGSGSGGGSGMSDLADFLRETEPPAPSGPVGGVDMRPLSPSKEKERGGFGGIFGRRKKVAI